MSRALVEGWKSFLKLCRFLFWYGLSVTAILYLLPMAAQVAESRYEAMSSTIRFFAVIGFFAIVGGWQVISKWGRMKALRQGRPGSGSDAH